MTGGPARERNRRQILQAGVVVGASLALAGCQERELDEIDGAGDGGTDTNGTGGEDRGTTVSGDESENRTRVVERGDTLWEIAEEEYGDPTKWRVIAEANDIDDPRELEVGRVLVIPELESEADSGDEGSGGDGGDRTYVVEEGDTLWEIAEEEYGDPTKWRVIAEANDIEDPRELEVGRVLVIPDVDSADDGGDGTSGDDSGDGTSGDDSGDRTYVVEEGDTLWDIAEAVYGDPTKWLLIAEANDIDDPRDLEPGTELVVPTVDPDDASPEHTYVVQEGDTLWDIAEQEYGDPSKWYLIAEANDIDDPRDLEPGTTLVVPDVVAGDETSGDDGGTTTCDDGGERTHVVEEGDTLWEIAEEEYGDPTKWDLIAEANGIEDPRELEPGRELVIPAETSCR